MQDDSFALENVTLLTKLYNHLYENTNALITIFVTLYVYHSSLLQGDSNSLYVSGQGLDSSLVSLTKNKQTNRVLRKYINIFQESHLICLSHIIICSISFYSWIHINLNSRFYFWIYTKQIINLQDVKSSSDSKGNTGAYFCSR